MKPWTNQLDNRNYLSPVGFKFTITKVPTADFSQTLLQFQESILDLQHNQLI